MATTITLKRFRKHPDGTVEAVFASSVSGETGRNYTGGIEEIHTTIDPMDDEEPTIGMFWAYWLARDADLSNPNIMLNKNFIVDFSNNNPIRVQ